MGKRKNSNQRGMRSNSRKNNFSRQAKPVLTGLLILGLAGAGGFFAWQNKGQIKKWWDKQTARQIHLQPFSAPGASSGKRVSDRPSAIPVMPNQKTAPVVSKPAMMRVKLYYYNELRHKQIASSDSCPEDSVMAVARSIPVTKIPVQDTIKLLLEGDLSPQEKAAGFSSEFPHPAFKLLNADLDGGVLTLRFADPGDFASAGACRVMLIATEIERTAKQFPQVKSVKYVPATLFEP